MLTMTGLHQAACHATQIVCQLICHGDFSGSCEGLFRALLIAKQAPQEHG
jgi:hypothetical protein